MFPRVLTEYVESGKVRYIFKNFPLSIHPWAQKAAESAECAGLQGKYWDMHEALFGSQDQWSTSQDAVPFFKQLAGQLKLDQAKFDSCLDKGDTAATVQADLQEGAAAGVTGTPAFRINDVPLSGAQPFEQFKNTIEYALAGGQPPSLIVPADSFRSKGEADAPVVLTEFSDFQ